MAASDPVLHVRRALAARQYDRTAPLDISDEVEVSADPNTPLPADFKTADGPLTFWCGFGEETYPDEDQAQRRYIAFTAVNVVLSAAKTGGERGSAVAGRVSRWLVGAIAAHPTDAESIHLARPSSLAMAAVTSTTRAGRVILTGVVTVEREVNF